MFESEQYKLGYENAVLDFQKKYDIRNITIILKPPPRPEGQNNTSQIQTHPEKPSVTNSQPLPKQETNPGNKAEKSKEVDRGEKVDHKEE